MMKKSKSSAEKRKEKLNIEKEIANQRKDSL